MIRSDARLRVLVVAPSRHPLRQPHAGGLEACVWDRVRWLRERGHRVTLCAPEGSDFLGEAEEFRLPAPAWTRLEDASDTMYPDGYAAELSAAMDRALARVRADRHLFDVVDNHSLHGAPILWSRDTGVPVVTTLHTPPLPEIVAASHAIGGRAPHRFVTVSQFTARSWSSRGVDAFVFPNGVDPTQWRLGAGGTEWVWFGRIVPEKAPHLAIHAARRAGARLRLAGRIGDAAYFAREVEPLLGDGITYVGPLALPALCDLVGASAVALVTPVWAEPFGLVLAEALMTGTPVAAFDSGGISEVLGGMPGTAIVPVGDADALARAATALAARSGASRRGVRRAAEARYSVQQRYRELERVLTLSAHGAVAAHELTEAVGA